MQIPKILRELYHDWITYRTANLEHLSQGLADRQSFLDARQHQEIIERIVQAYRKTQAIAESSLPLPYHVGGAWREDINNRRKEYLEALDADDKETLVKLFANFFRNSGVAGTWSYGYYLDVLNGNKKVKKGFATAILKDYQVWKDLVEGVKIADIAAPPIGNAWGLVMDGSLIMADSLRYNYYANQVHNLLVDINRPVVAEIGGGYGGFAYFFLKSEKNCVYIGYDIPIILTVQTYYLMNAFPEKRFLLFDNVETSITSETLNAYDVILMPHFQLPRLANDAVDLFINSHSLSEMDYPTVAEYLSQIGRTCKHYFFHENSDRDVLNTGDHIEVPASGFSIPPNFKKIYKHYSPWEGGIGRQREYLYGRF
jgi:putative sugar O-methyltransferase